MTLDEIKNEIARKETTPSVNWDELAPIQKGLLMNIVATEYAKQFQEELENDRIIFFEVLKSGAMPERTKKMVEMKITLIDLLLKK